MTGRTIRNELLDFEWRHRRPLRGIAVIVTGFTLVAYCAGTPDDGTGYLEIGTAAAGSRAPVVGAAVVTTPAVRAPVQVQVGPPPTPPPTTTTTLPHLVARDCPTWRSTVERYGMPWDWALPIMQRESGCSHALADRPSTGDLSIGAFQINYYSSSMARWWAENGWTWALVSGDPEAAVAAAGALFAACGTGPWDRAAGYPCRGDGVLRTPAEMGYGP